MLETNLSGAQDVAGRVQREADTAAIPRRSIGYAVDAGSGSQALTQDRDAGFGAEIGVVARKGVIAMAMGDDRSRHGPGWIQIKIAGSTVETPWRGLEQRRRHDPQDGRIAQRGKRGKAMGSKSKSRGERLPALPPNAG